MADIYSQIANPATLDIGSLINAYQVGQQNKRQQKLLEMQEALFPGQMQAQQNELAMQAMQIQEAQRSAKTQENIKKAGAAAFNPTTKQFSETAFSQTLRDAGEYETANNFDKVFADVRNSIAVADTNERNAILTEATQLSQQANAFKAAWPKMNSQQHAAAYSQMRQDLLAYPGLSNETVAAILPEQYTPHAASVASDIIGSIGVSANVTAQQRQREATKESPKEFEVMLELAEIPPEDRTPVQRRKFEAIMNKYGASVQKSEREDAYAMLESKGYLKDMDTKTAGAYAREVATIAKSIPGVDFSTAVEQAAAEVNKKIETSGTTIMGLEIPFTEKRKFKQQPQSPDELKVGETGVFGEYEYKMTEQGLVRRKVQ